MSVFEYLTPTEDEAPDLALMLAQALHFERPTLEGVQPWLERVGHEDFRCVRADGRVAAGLKLIWMGQWFGGVKVPAAGVTVVGTAPEHRGKGAGGWMMKRMHEEVRERGYPLATLFPATLTFYRGSGYERAGAWNEYEIELSKIGLKDRGLDVWPVEKGDYAEVKRLYDLRAARTNGMLDRVELMWKRCHEPREKVAFRYLFGSSGAAEGYVAFTQGGQFEAIKITDHCALTREANLRLLTFFADHRSLATKVSWYGGPNDPLLYLLPEQSVKPLHRLDWMVRITDVERALSLRGYPPGLSVKIDLEVTDNQLPGNQGRFTVDISEGRAEVRRGGSAALRMDVRTLAPLYTGYYTAQELMVLGGLEGDTEALAAAQLAFSGPRPWMEDIF
jgi:predicted acetyltransferase